jgi:hypothetical protein
MKTKFAIGCLVQFYEIDIVEYYIESVKYSLEEMGNNEDIIVDICLNVNEGLEKLDKTKISMNDIINKLVQFIQKHLLDFNVDYRVNEDKIYTVADYRRDFNEKYCDKVDVLMWGETDSLLPKQTFLILDNLHQTSVQNGNLKYLSFFGTCKMWDDSWKPIEHNDFTDKLHSDDKGDWWSLNYTMNIEEMNEINDKVDELDVRIVSPHKFNGCGLVISSEVIKSGVNIPRSAFFVHEDTAFQIMTNKVLGDIPQYVIKNILLVHNRKNINKRKYIQGESGNTIGKMRQSNDWYELANKMCEQNNHNLFNPNYKSFTWDDVFERLGK